MARDQSALLELAETAQRADGRDLMRKLLQTMLQSLVAARIGAEPHWRSSGQDRCTPVGSSRVSGTGPRTAQHGGLWPKRPAPRTRAVAWRRSHHELRSVPLS